jgi:DNA-binding transcriptional regulator YbjK
MLAGMPPRTPPARDGSDRATAIADAAIELLAEGGTRALTHRMVDRRLGIPEGSTSVYHRTRKKLIRAAATRVAERELAAIASTELAVPADADPAEVITMLVTQALSPQRRSQTLARYVLATEAANDHELGEVLMQSRGAYLERSQQLLTRAGAAQPEQTAPALAAFINGLVLGQFNTPDPLLTGDDLCAAIEQFLTGARST